MDFPQIFPSSSVPSIRSSISSFQLCLHSSMLPSMPHSSPSFFLNPFLLIFRNPPLSSSVIHFFPVFQPSSLFPCPPYPYTRSVLGSAIILILVCGQWGCSS